MVESGGNTQSSEAGRQYLGELLEYSSLWFNYHAQQRVQSFYLFLIVESAVSVAYSTLYQKITGGVLGGVAFAGAIVAVWFMALELRNTELVNSGRHVLDQVEAELKKVGIPWHLPRQRDRAWADLADAMKGWRRHRPNTSPVPSDPETIPSPGEPQGCRQRLIGFSKSLISHSFVFRSFFVATIAFGLAVAIWTWTSYSPGTSASPPCRHTHAASRASRSMESTLT